MKDLKIPGFVWTVGIVLAVVFCENFLPPEYQLYGQMAVVVLMGLAKAMNLGVKDIEELLALLREIKAKQPPMMRSSEGALVAPTVTISETEIQQHEPNKVMRFLLG